MNVLETQVKIVRRKLKVPLNIIRYILIYPSKLTPPFKMSDRSTKDAFTSKRERSHRNGNSTRLFAAAKAREAEARIVVLKKKLEALQEKHRLEEESTEKRLKEGNDKRRRKEKEEAAEREKRDIELCRASSSSYFPIFSYFIPIFSTPSYLFLF